MRDATELKVNFKKQFIAEIDGCTETDPKVAFAGGMLVLLSAFKKFDGPSLAYQITIMHAALRELGDERGWEVSKRR